MGKLIPLKFAPGINREGTSFSNEGGWWDCDKVRFRKGFPETIGGWVREGDTTFTGTCRDVILWQALSTVRYVGLGTHLKYQIFYANTYYDVTPIRETTAAGDVTFSASNGDATLTVSDTSHGGVAGDYVTYSGAVSLGGNITADVLNQEYQIGTVVDADSYTIEAKDTSGNEVVANASDTGNGGASTVGEYQVAVGLDDFGAGGSTGWGSDGWGLGAWSEASADSISLRLRLWSADTFGEDLVTNIRGGNIYYWDATDGVSTRMVALEDLPNANLPPTNCLFIMTSDQDRHVIAFGCDPFDNPGVRDPLLIRWCDQEDISDWVDSTTNTAGSIRLSYGSEIITAIQTRQLILVFTNSAVYGMQFIGPPNTFGVQPLATGTTIISQNSAVSVNNFVFWMGDENFYLFDGTVKELPCTIKEYVFDALNRDQHEKVFAGVNSTFSEVWWFYPVGDECDRYAVYNYAENLWFYGTMERTAWADRGIFTNPIAAGTDHYLYAHESGLNDGEENPAVGIDAYIESSQFDIAEGDAFMFMERLIPDVTFRDSEAADPEVTITLKAREWPGEEYIQTDDGSVTQTATLPVEKFTKRLDIRLRGRSTAFRIDSSGDQGVAWRLGVPRIGVQPDGAK